MDDEDEEEEEEDHSQDNQDITRVFIEPCESPWAAICHGAVMSKLAAYNLESCRARWRISFLQDLPRSRADSSDGTLNIAKT